MLTFVAFAVGIVLLAVFVTLERRASEPITPLVLFTDRSRNASYVGRLFLVAGMFGMFFFMTQFLQDVLGYGPLETGLAFLPFSLALFGMSQLSARRLIERFGPKPLMVVGFSFSALAMLLMTQLSATSTYITVLVPVMLFGIGNGLGVRAADRRVAGRRAPGGRRRGVRAGQRDAADGRRAGAGGAGVGVRLGRARDPGAVGRGRSGRVRGRR